MRELVDEKDEDFYYDDIMDRQTRLVVKLLSRLKNLKLLVDIRIRNNKDRQLITRVKDRQLITRVTRATLVVRQGVRLCAGGATCSSGQLGNYASQSSVLRF